MTARARELALRQAVKNARRARRAVWEAYPVNDRLDYDTAELMLRLDLTIAELLGRLDGHRRWEQRWEER